MTDIIITDARCIAEATRSTVPSVAAER